jgi:hypothetical protein
LVAVVFVAVTPDQAASFGDFGVRTEKRAGDDGGWGVDRTDVAWERGEAKTRALVTNDPSKPVRGGRIMMTSARVSRPRWRSAAPGLERSARPD